jgi:hypothetical protein
MSRTLGRLSDNKGHRMGDRGRARLLAREVSKSIQQADVSQEGEGKGSRYGNGLRSRARGCRSYPTPKLSPRFGRRHTGTRRVTGVFKKWQSLYAEKGIATFPVNDNKKPCTKAYDKVGPNGSAELAEKFSDADAFGFLAGRRSGVRS